MTRVIYSVAFLTTFGATLISSQALYASEPSCAECEACTTILSKIPYLNRLFKNVAVAAHEEECVETITWTADAPCRACVKDAPYCVQPFQFRHVGDDGLERIGVDFDFEFHGPSATAECTAIKCAAEKCESEQCATEQCPVGPCATEQGPPAFAVFGPPMLPLDGPGRLLMQLECLSEHNQQLIEALVESRVENATLAAKVEFAQEREQLVVENAVLKAQSAAPLMVAKQESEADLLRAENAALKAKLAAIEERLATLERPVKKTADKATTKRKR